MDSLSGRIVIGLVWAEQAPLGFAGKGKQSLRPLCLCWQSRID
jgi:hypothetical protein